MSKVITQRYEYACFDDAAPGSSLTSTPPLYPPVLDNYQGNCSQSAASTYGTAAVTGAGLTSIQTSPGANVTIIAPVANTTLVNISTPAGVPLTVGGSATQVKWLVGPGQTVTFPGVWNTTGVLTVQAIDTSFTAQATAFSLQAMWSV